MTVTTQQQSLKFKFVVFHCFLSFFFLFIFLYGLTTLCGLPLFRCPASYSVGISLFFNDLGHLGFLVAFNPNMGQRRRDHDFLEFWLIR